MKHIISLVLLLWVYQPVFSQIVGQANDTNYHNTTIVFVKENTNGSDVLNKMEHDFGMGDMVRIEIAQTPPVNKPVNTVSQAVKPVATTTKPAATPTKITQTAVIDTGLSKSQKKPVVQSAKPVVNNIAPTQITVAPQQVQTVRTVSKSAKKSVNKKKCKSRPPFMASVMRKKPGKQKYGCPKF